MQLRKEVREFAEAMEAVLRENDDKGGWSHLEDREIKDKIIQELAEFSAEETHGYIRNARKEAVDIANFCMMYWDNNR